MLKLPKGKKKNQKIYWDCLEIIETKQNIYDYQMEKYKRKIGYFQKIQMVKLSKDNKIKNQKFKTYKL